MISLYTRNRNRRCTLEEALVLLGTDTCTQYILLQLFIDSDEDRHVQRNGNETGQETLEQVSDTFMTCYLNH